MKKNYIISIDFGGTKILSALVNSKEGIIARVKKSTKDAATKAELAALLYESIVELLDGNNVLETSVKSICIGAPGSVDPFTGVIGLAPNLGFQNFNIKDALQKFTDIPVLLENDVNLAALGIANFDVAKDKQNVLVVFIGTGIGGGWILNGNIYRGNRYAAGEIGHMHVLDNGPICGCGNKGCFEAVASRSAMVRDIVKDIKSGKRSKLSKLVKAKAQIKSKSLYNAMASADPVTAFHVHKACAAIGKTLAGINNLMNLDMIVLGGGVIEAMKAFTVPIIKTTFNQFSLKQSSKKTKIVVSKLLDDAALYGGIPLTKEFLNIEV